MRGEEANEPPVDFQSRLGDRHLIAHEVLCRTNDRPFRKDHHSFSTTGVLRNVKTVPSKAGFLLHQTRNERRIVPATNDLTQRGHIGIHFYQQTRGSVQI